MKLIKLIFLILTISPVTILCQFTGGSDDGYSKFQYNVPGADNTFRPEKLPWINDGYSRVDYIIPNYQTQRAFQVIILSQGWNMISSNIAPNNTQLNSVFYTLGYNFKIAKNNIGNVYWPEWDINDIGDWDITQGYQVYVSNSDYLYIYGDSINPSNTPINLPPSWNMISYLSNYSMPPSVALTSIQGSFLILKDNIGNVYWPDWGIDDIGNMQPGQGYQIYMNQSDILIYPANLELGDIRIGNQIWKQKNLDVDHYRNGDIIPQVTDGTAWANLTTGAWCYYNNDPAMGAVYGKLYNWYALNDSRGLAPEGWHVASDAEWATLTNYLGGESVTGGKLKETGIAHWAAPNTGATNESWFTALPGGWRINFNGTFYGIGNYGYWWSATESSSAYAWGRYLNYNTTNIFRDNLNKEYGFSVRCVRNN